MTDNPIDQALGLRPIDDAKEETNDIVSVEAETLPDVVSDEDDETIRDIDLAKSNIQNIIRQGDDSLKDMIDLAKQSESPRAFEVAANLMKTLLDANKDYVEMSEKKKERKKEISGPGETNQTNITNNNLILSTTDLLKKLKGDE